MANRIIYTMAPFSINDFETYCDNLIRDWHDDPTSLLPPSKTADPFLTKSDILAGKEKEKPYFDVMPEPFLGDPENCSIVMINLNPGYSKGDENVLARSAYPTLCPSGYSAYAKAFPHLDKKPFHTEGAKWWTARKKYLDKIVSQYCDTLLEDDKNRRPFAVELCPWHSKKWGEAGISIDSAIYNRMETRSLAPAFYAIKHSLVDFAVVVGAAAIPVLEQNGFKLIQSFGPEKDIEGTPYPRLSKDNISFDNYPQTTKKRNKQPVGESDAEVFYKYYKKGDLKVLSVSKTGSNNTPGPEYASRGIEKVILDYIKTH